MGMSEIILRPKGELFLYSNGKLIRHKKNLVVNLGIYLILDLLIGDSSSTIGYWNIGSGLTLPSAGDTDLESGNATRTAISSVSRSNNLITLTGQAGTTTYNQVWSEFGLFFASVAANSLFSRVVFDPYTKVAGSTIDWIYKISL